MKPETFKNITKAINLTLWMPETKKVRMNEHLFFFETPAICYKHLGLGASIKYHPNFKNMSDNSVLISLVLGYEIEENYNSLDRCFNLEQKEKLKHFCKEWKFKTEKAFNDFCENVYFPFFEEIEIENIYSAAPCRELTQNENLELGIKMIIESLNYHLKESSKIGVHDSNTAFSHWCMKLAIAQNLPRILSLDEKQKEYFDNCINNNKQFNFDIEHYFLMLNGEY